jgi:branched-chain amino acid transport system permease protein
MTLFLNAIVAGLAIGSVYGMIALSYTIVFNATHVFNVAQGDIVAVGILLTWLFVDQAHLPQLLSLLLVVLGVVVVCLLEERLVVRRFLSAGHGAAGIGVFIATLAFALVLETVNSLVYGSRPLADVPSIAGSSTIRFGSVTITPMLLLAFIALVVITGLLELFYKRSWLGTAMRACAEDREVTALRGINPIRIGQLAFGIAGLVSGIAGFILAPIVTSDITVGLTYGLKGFVALAIGGFGSFRGALLGAWALGICEQLFDLYGKANYEGVVGLALLLVVLAVRPTGLFGQGSVRVV